MTGSETTIARRVRHAMSRAGVLSNLVVPVIAVIALAATWGQKLPGGILLLIAVLVAATIMTAVHHAEVIADKVGEPYGSIILAVAVTVVEVGLIVSLMAGGGDASASLARDTVFAALMISVTGMIGISLYISSMNKPVVYFNAEGAGAAVATLAVLGTITLVLPSFINAPGDVGYFSTFQMAVVAALALLIYSLFVFAQTLRHRTYFLPVDEEGDVVVATEAHEPPSGQATATSLVLLVVALIGVVGLAKVGAKPVEDSVASAGLPQAIVGVLIALVVLTPESLAAFRAASRGMVQVSLNLALGSSIAAIGLTIPVVAALSIWRDESLLLGLSNSQIALFAIAMITALQTVTSGRTTVVNGGLHIALFVVFLLVASGL